MKSIKTIAIVLFSFLSLIAFGQFALPQLPYKYDALEPHIDSVTMRIHHTAHHAAYVNNLNKAIEKYAEYSKYDLEKLLKNINNLPKEIQTAVRNNGGGHYNHDFFWKIMAPAGTKEMSSNFENILIKNFGSVSNFKEQFEKSATGRFGSGWVWLMKRADGTLYIESTPNQDNMLMPFNNMKGKPILALDVWEHAYYLKHQSKRAAYVKAFWNVVNWEKVEDLYKN